MHRDIAVIGMAGRFPDAKNTDELVRNLKSGRDSVRDISPERVKSTALPVDKQYKAAGYLEGIDCFDYDFFGLSFEEAQVIDPHQRLLLEVVHEAIENAGYKVDYFAGTDTATYVGSSTTDYYKHANQITPQLIAGNSSSFLASRINRVFGLSGNAVVVEAACASSLVALQQACNALLLKETGCVVVCGVHLELFPYKEDLSESVLVSADGKSRAFSANATGMSSGEAVCCLVCKPLDQAIADGDHIQAVIKSVVSNNNARRSVSLTAPDSIAQAEAALRAWQLANITPDQIGFVEAHGSGTLLGDSIEISGLDIAFRKYTTEKSICPVATIKSNIGHTSSAAGLVGLIKAILALRQQVIFPAIHTEEPSPLINFKGSALYLPQQPEHWPAGSGQTRYAAVNAVSQNGTNCHVVVAEAPAPLPAQATMDMASPYAIITCSSLRSEGVRDNLAALLEKMRTATAYALPDISYTLGQGRKHYRYRCAFVVRSRGELLQTIEAYIGSTSQPCCPQVLKKIIFVLTDHAHIPAHLWHYCITYHPLFKAAYAQCLQYANEGVHENAGLGAFVFQYCFYKLIEAHGSTTGTFLTVGVGKVVRSVMMGDISLQQGVATAEVHQAATKTQDLVRRVESLLAKESAGGPVAFVPLGPASDLSREITRQMVPDSGVHCFSLPDDPASSPLLEVFKFLYLAGYDILWEAFFKYTGGAKIDLPGYQFEKKKCWIRQEPRTGNDPETVSPATPEADFRKVLAEEATPIEHKIASFWKEVLPIDSLMLDHDFYEIGGSVAEMGRVINRIKESFGIALTTVLPDNQVSVKSQAGEVFLRLSTQQKIMLFWEEVLGSDQTDASRNFFEVGGYSLLAIKIINRINQSFGCNLTLKEFFMNPTVEAMASCLDSIGIQVLSSPGGRIEKLEAEQDSYPVSHAQKRVWITSQVEGCAASYNIPYSFELTGSVDKTRFQRVFETLLARHESLRTVFCQVEGQIRQRILPTESTSFRIEQRSLVGQADGLTQARKWAAEEAAEPFDLEKGLLLRVKLIELAAGKHIFLLTIHHLISDGWSMKVLMQEMLLLYQAFSAGKDNPLAPLRIQYKDYTVWQNMQLLQDEDLSRQRKYWLTQLSGELPALNLPTDGERSSDKASPCQSISFELGEPLSTNLRKICQEHNSTVFTTLLAAVKLLLFKYTAQEDIRVGTPVAGRKVLELENQVGCYVNTVVLRSKINDDNSFTVLQAEVQNTTLSAYANQDYPFDRLVSDLPHDSRANQSTLFNVMVVNETRSEVESAWAACGLQVTELGTSGAISRMDLVLGFEENAGRITVHVEYNSVLFSQAWAERFCHHLTNVLSQVTAHPGIRIREVDVLSAQERKQLLEAFNNTQIDYPLHVTLRELFEQQVENRPDAIALVDREHLVTYYELNRKANRLAHYLKSTFDLKPNDIVALIVDRSELMVTGLLAVLKAGAAYLPLDPDAPPDRIQYMLGDARPKTVLIDREEIHRKFDLVAYHPVLLPSPTESYPDELPNPARNASPGDIAYVIYTSGSTGRPKGVMVEIAGVVNRLHWQWHAYDFLTTDVILQKTPYTFDVSVEELFLPLCFGARLVLCPKEMVYDPVQLAAYINCHHITTIHFVPSALNTFQGVITSAEYQGMRSLRHIFTSGETLLPATVKRHYQYSDIPLYNMYGPTETTVEVSFFNTSPSGDRVPIGEPIPNNQLYVLDKHLQLVPVGVEGEICISGVGVARGYLNRPELTREKFTDHPFIPHAVLYRSGDIGRWCPDGKIEFVSRNDKQVKIRGYRVELGEIENILTRHPAVVQGVVVTQPDEYGMPELTAYFKGREPVEGADLRTFLNHYLPEYMLPTYFVALGHLPVTPNGKVDYKALPLPKTLHLGGTEAYQAPESPVEQRLVEVWERLLGQQPIGIQTNFYSLGGDSIKAVQVAAMMYKLGYIIDVRDVLQHGTISKIARVAKERVSVSDQSLPEGIVPLTPIQQEFFRTSPVDEHHYNQSLMLFNADGLDEAEVSAVFAKITGHHDALRATFVRTQEGIVQNIGEAASAFSLEVFEMDGLEQLAEKRQSIAAAAQAKFDLAQGPLVKLVLFPSREGSYLVIIIHHLVVDGVSWRILLEDLDTLLIQYRQGARLVLPLKTDSYKTWAEHQLQHANGKQLLQERAYWQRVSAAINDCPPLAEKACCSYVRDTESLTFELNDGETQLLLKSVNAAFNTEINDILLAALGLGIYAGFGCTQVAVALEGHGREPLDNTITVSRTVGWFTSVYPVVLSLTERHNLGTYLATTKETLRQVPAKGTGYGILKHLTSSEHTGRIDFAARPSILFNYLGQFDSDFNHASFRVDTSGVSNTVSPNRSRIYAIEVTGVVVEKQLRIHIVFSPGQYKLAALEAFRDGFRESLREIIAFCSGRQEKQRTPSDFDYKGLSLQEFDTIFD